MPGDHFYDLLRFKPGEKEGFQCEANPFKALAEHDAACSKCQCPYGLTGQDVPSSLPIAPMNQNPTTCVGPLDLDIDVFSYDLEWTHAQADWPATTGCDALSFDPSLAANPTTTDTDTASGVDVVLSVPQFQDPNTPSPSELKASTITFPKGFSLNPSAADGKVTCSDAAVVGRHRRRGALPGVLEDRHGRPRQLRAAGADQRLPLPGRAEARRAVPDGPDGKRLRHRGEAPRQRSTPTRQTASS